MSPTRVTTALAVLIAVTLPSAGRPRPPEVPSSTLEIVFRSPSGPVTVPAVGYSLRGHYPEKQLQLQSFPRPGAEGGVRLPFSIRLELRWGAYAVHCGAADEPWTSRARVFVHRGLARVSCWIEPPHGARTPSSDHVVPGEDATVQRLLLSRFGHPVPGLELHPTIVVGDTRRRLERVRTDSGGRAEVVLPAESASVELLADSEAEGLLGAWRIAVNPDVETLRLPVEVGSLIVRSADHELLRSLELITTDGAVIAMIQAPSVVPRTTEIELPTLAPGDFRITSRHAPQLDVHVVVRAGTPTIVDLDP